MPAKANVQHEELVNTATLLAHKVNRTVLQQALVESRLFGRNDDPDEMRRLSRTQSAWVAFVTKMLRNPDTRGAGFRALGILVNSYVKESTLDQRIENALRKGKQAAERGDTDRLQREIGKVRRLADELHISELNDPAVVLMMWASSEFVRERISDVSRAETTIPLVETPVAGDTEVPLKDTPPADLTVEQSINASLIADLKAAAIAMPRIETLNWPFKQLILDEQIPANAVSWPTVDDLAAPFAKLNDLGAQLARLPGSDQSPVLQHIGKYRAVLEGLMRATADIENAKAALSNIEAEVRRVAQGQIEFVDESLRAELEAAIQLLNEDHLLWPNAIDTIDALVSRNSQLAVDTRSRLLEIVESIQTLAGNLPLEKQNIAEAKVRFLVRRKRMDDLRKLEEQLKQEVSELHDVSRRIREAAATALPSVESIAAPISQRLVELLLAAVRLGDTEQAKVVIARAHREAAPVPAALAIAATVSSMETAPTLHFDEPPTQPDTRRERLTFLGRLEGFVPRDRVSQYSQVSNDAAEVLRFLLQRALQEMRRGSILGVLDHALDMLLISTRDPVAGVAWTDVALSLAASLPPRPGAFTEWGDQAADQFIDDLEHFDSPMFSNRLNTFVSETGFSDAVAERFVHKEVTSIVKDLATSLYNSTKARSSHLLEDLARGVGAGARYGDVQVSRALLTELAILAACNDTTLQRLRQALDGIPADQKTPTFNWAPHWMAQGLLAYRDAVAERKNGPLKARTRGSFNVQVPQSVQVSGGFVYNSGSDQVDLALQVGNPQALQCIAAELVVPAQRNSWLARDAVCYLGALPAKARLLAPLRLQFNQELVDPGKLDIQTELRFKDYSTSSTQAQDDRLALPLSKAAAIAVEDYEGALGKPIILQGETLKLSSESVRQALVYVRHNLGRGSVTALILGRRRRGKTSILQTVAQDPDIRRDYVIIADTIEDLPFRSLAEVLGHLGNVLDRVARQLDLECEPLEPLLRTQSHLGWVTIQEWLASVDRKLTKKHRVLLLLDEFQKWLSLLEPESRTRILSILRGLNNRPQDAFLSLSVVLSGLSNIREYARTSADFLNAYRLLEVKAFTADEAAALIRSNPSIEFDTRAVSRIASLSGGNPFLINLLGNEIAGRLREQGRPYCFPDDVERVVRSQLEDRQNSRVWTFLQYLLKQGEEDHASEIVELPGLLALAWTLRARGAQRRTVSVLEIVDEFNTLGVECDTNTLATYLNGATQNELLGRQGDRYSFASEWLAEWLAVTVSDGPLPVTPSKNQDLVLNRYRISELIDTWVMHTKSTPRDDSARLVAGRQ